MSFSPAVFQSSGLSVLRTMSFSPPVNQVFQSLQLFTISSLAYTPFTPPLISLNDFGER